MQFSLVPGTYNIEVSTYGCQGKTPSQDDLVHFGECNGVTVEYNGDVECNMYMISQEELDDMKNEQEANEGSSYDPVISSLTLTHPRIDLNADTNNRTSVIGVSVIDFDRRESHGHYVAFTASESGNSDSVTWSQESGFMNLDADAAMNGDTKLKGDALGDVCPVTDLSAPDEQIKKGTFPCVAYLGVERDITGDTVFFNVEVQGTNDGAIAGPAYKVYGSIGIEKTTDDALTIKLTHQPKLCDGYHEEVTCANLDHFLTSSVDTDNSTPTYTRGPSMVVNTDARFQTRLGIAALEDSGNGAIAESDLLGDAGGFEAYNAIRVPVNYDNFDPYYATGETAWRNQFILMEAFVTDEDLAYPGGEEEVRLEVTLASRGVEMDGRTDPTCGRFVPITKAIQVKNTGGLSWDKDGTDALNVAELEDLNLNIGPATKTHTFNGDTHGREVGEETGTAKRKTRRFQWLWQPFYGLDLTDVPSGTSREDMKDWIGQQICEFDFEAKDDSSSIEGIDEDQSSNTVGRSFKIGTDPATYAIADLAEPVPTFQGGFFWTSSPAAASILPMTFRFMRETRCSVAGHSALITLTPSEYTEEQTYCWTIEKGYKVAFYLHRADTDTLVSNIDEAEVRTKNGQGAMPTEEYGKDAIGPSNKVDLSVFWGAAASNKEYKLYVVAYNENDEAEFAAAGSSGYTSTTPNRWFVKRYDFHVKSVAETGSLTFADNEVTTTTTIEPTQSAMRKRRSLLSLVQVGTSTGLTARRGAGRGRRDLKKPLLAEGNPIKITTTSGQTLSAGGVNTGVDIAFSQTTLFNGKSSVSVVSAATGGNSVIATNDLLNRTAQLCSIIADGSGAADDQLKELVSVYAELLGEMQATDKTTTSQISRIMDKLRMNEGLTEEKSKIYLAELKKEVESMLAEQSNVVQVVDNEIAMMTRIQNQTSFRNLKQENVWAYMINKMETFEDALAVIQYSAAEAVDYRFTEAATIDAIALVQTDQKPTDGTWFASAAGGTQVTTLVLTGIMFVVGAVVTLKNMGGNDETGNLKGAYSLASNMNF